MTWNLTYIDENGETINIFCDNVVVENGFVKFDSKKNILFIPVSRVLKMKQMHGDTA